MFTSQILVFAVIFCLVTVNARHHAERPTDTEDLAVIQEQPTLDNIRQPREHVQKRHRRKRWQSNIGYNYPAPQQPFYEERRDYYGQSDLQGQILRLLDELSTYVKRPPPPPQPIYVPYPVPYPVPQYQCNCGSSPTNNTAGVPDLGSRVKMDDVNQNWGFADNDDVDNASYDRPLSFTPSRPMPAGRAPALESSQRELKADSSKPRSRTCDVAVLSCCIPSDSPQKQFRCFSNAGCGSRFSKTVCNKDEINRVLDAFGSTYGITQNV